LGGAREGCAYVADCVVGDVDAVLEEAFCARLAGGGDLGGVDDLVGGRFYDVGCVEVEELLVLFPVVVLLGELVEEVVLAVLEVGFLSVGRGCDGESGRHEGEESGCGEVHVGYIMEQRSIVVVIVDGGFKWMMIGIMRVLSSPLYHYRAPDSFR
jgi:hypothetical protein